MIEPETAEVGTRILAAAIWQLLQDAQHYSTELPRNGFQQRMRFAGLAEVGRDLAALAAASVVMLRRSRMDIEQP